MPAEGAAGVAVELLVFRGCELNISSRQRIVTHLRVTLQKSATPAEQAAVDDILLHAEVTARTLSGSMTQGTEYLVKVQPSSSALLQDLTSLPGIASVVPVAGAYVLASSTWKRNKTVVSVGNVRIGAVNPVIIAGPCAVEDSGQIAAAAQAAKDAGAHILRGGGYKPRTSPYSFQGLGMAGVELLADAGARVGMPVVTEVMDPGLVDDIAATVDMLQVGSRNMQNTPLLRAVGRSGKPVLLKRGFAATIDEWLSAAEYILAEGNPNVVLCERGVRGFDPSTRFTVDINCIPLLSRLTHLPVVVDPSHGTGHRDLVLPIGLAAIAAGASGLIVEMHPIPDEAFSDAEQAIDPQTLRNLISRAELVHSAVG